MALKKENQEVVYSERIGVNRGSGFAAGASIFKQTANALDNLTSTFADQALTSIQKAGKKLDLYPTIGTPKVSSFSIVLGRSKIDFAPAEIVTMGVSERAFKS